MKKIIEYVRHHPVVSLLAVLAGIGLVGMLANASSGRTHDTAIAFGVVFVVAMVVLVVVYLKRNDGES